jgi:hypothetical protein
MDRKFQKGDYVLARGEVIWIDNDGTRGCGLRVARFR